MKRQRLTGFEVMEDAMGNVHTSGVPSDPVNRHIPIDLIERAPLEVVVESVYYTDEDDRNAVTKNSQRAVMVDVRTLGQFCRQARYIPVLQRSQGLWDEDVYIPRPTRLDIDGNDLSTGSAIKGDKKPTPAESMDGDRGLLFFLESNPAKPIFFPYSQGHPKANNPRTRADGRVRRIRHAGVLMEWSEDGNWTLDATEAAKQELAANGDEQPNNGTAGQVTLKTKDGAGSELFLFLDGPNGNVHLHDGGGAETLTLTKSTGTAKLNASLSAVVDAVRVNFGADVATSPLLKSVTFGPAWLALFAPLNAAAATAISLCAIPTPPTNALAIITLAGAIQAYGVAMQALLPLGNPATWSTKVFTE